MSTTPSAAHHPAHAPLVAGVLVGSLRRQSYNRMVAQTLPELAPEGLTLKLLPPLNPLPVYDADVQEAGIPQPVAALAEALRGCDALVIVTPEYNYSIPGGLKNALDWLSRLPDKPLSGLPVALQSASQGALGGVRCQYHLRHVLVALNALALNVPEVIIGSVQGKVDAAAGRLTDADARRFAGEQLKALQQLVRQQRAGRVALDGVSA